MKWIKHQTATRRDEKVARLIAQYGWEAYGVYWAVQEIIADQMTGKDPSCSVSYPISTWSHLLLTRGSLVFSSLSRLAVTGLVTVEREDSEIRVTNRKLLKYRDEYSTKSGHNRDKVGTGNTEADTEAEEDKKEKVKKEKSPETGLFDITPPEWLPLEAWMGWMEVRLVKKDKNGRVVPWTRRCAQIAIGKLARWHSQNYDLIKILDGATGGNWQGLYLPKDDHGEEIKPEKAYVEVPWEDAGLIFDRERNAWVNHEGQLV